MREIMRKKSKPNYFKFPDKHQQPESFVLRTTITLSHIHHAELIQALEAAPSKAYVIRELMIRGLAAYQEDLAREMQQ